MSDVDQFTREAVSRAVSQPQSGPEALPNFVLPMDLGPILQAEKKVHEISSISNMTGPVYMQEFLAAKELACRYYADASYLYEKAADQARKEKALAYLERAPGALKLLDRKPTDEGCKMYVETDDKYRMARDKEIYFQTLAEYIKHKIYLFQSAHDDAKKIYDQMGEAFGGRTGLPSTRDKA